MNHSPIIHDFTILAVEVKSECAENIKKVLKEGFYFLNRWYLMQNGKWIPNKEAEFVRKLYGEKVSVQAVVGQNGSGKSSLLELIYRIINNLSRVMLYGMNRPAAYPMHYVEGIFATLYFVSGGKVGSIISKNTQLVFQWGEDEPVMFDVTKQSAIWATQNGKCLEYISKHFCYTLVCNYAMMSLVQTDFNRDVCYRRGYDHYMGNGAWLESIYNKNDGYQAAIGIEPFKGGGIIDVYKLKKLNDERVAALLIDAQQHKSAFFEDYSLNTISLNFDLYAVSKKYNDNNQEVKDWSRHPEKEIGNLWKNKKTFAHLILKSYGFDYFNTTDEVVRMAMAYVVYKTLSIAKKYPRYSRYGLIAKTTYYARETESFDKKLKERLRNTGRGKEAKEYLGAAVLLDSLCKEIMASNTHVELKVRQALNFLKAVKRHYKEIGLKWMCPEISSYEMYRAVVCKDDILGSPSEILEYYPPQFYDDTILLQKGNKTMPFYALSTGEKQFMQMLVTILYHLRNIISVKAVESQAKYDSVNLMLDEVEACFHPEYQQKFLKTLLDMLDKYHIMDTLAVNIIIATHSPFILSDIPGSNVLYLEDGGEPQDRLNMKNSFCGNVCDMLQQSFFLHEGFMGHFAKMKVMDLIQYLKSGERGNYTTISYWNKEDAKAMIEIIGEPLLKNSLMKLWSERFEKDNNSLIEWHKKEIERLKKGLVRL